MLMLSIFESLMILWEISFYYDDRAMKDEKKLLWT